MYIYIWLYVQVYILQCNVHVCASCTHVHNVHVCTKKCSMYVNSMCHVHVCIEVEEYSIKLFLLHHTGNQVEATPSSPAEKEPGSTASKGAKASKLLEAMSIQPN